MRVHQEAAIFDKGVYAETRISISASTLPYTVETKARPSDSIYS